MKISITEYNCPDCHRRSKNKKERFCPECGVHMLPIKDYVFIRGVEK